MADQLLEALGRLRLIESQSIPILSVYLDLAPERIERRSIGARLRDLMAPLERLASSGDLDHESSMSIRAGIDHVLEMESIFGTELGSGIAVFVCDRLDLLEHLTMPRRVWDCAVAGPRPYLRPLQAVLDEFRRVVAVVLDARGAEIVMYHRGDTLERHVIEAEELRKSDLAGWHGLEERRHRTHAEEARNRLFREIAELLNRLRRDAGVELVLVGGQEEVTNALLPFLDDRVAAITQEFVIDLHTMTPAILASEVARLEEQFERREEAREVEETYAAAAEGDLSVVGVERVLRAANRLAVARLYLHDGASLEGSICAGCGALWLPVSSCVECGGVVVPTPDVFEDLVRSVGDAGGSVEHVMTPTRLSQDLVAAKLRFLSW